MHILAFDVITLKSEVIKNDKRVTEKGCISMFDFKLCIKSYSIGILAGGTGAVIGITIVNIINQLTSELLLQ